MQAGGTGGAGGTGTSGGGAGAAGTALTWTDPTTNLMWQGKNATGSMTMAEAASYCAGSSLAGYTGWRLPTLPELRGLIRGCAATVIGGPCGATDACLAAPCFGSAGSSACDGCPINTGPTGGWYWPDGVTGSASTFCSSSLVADDTNLAWIVDFSRAQVDYYSLTNPYYARCVRS